MSPLTVECPMKSGMKWVVRRSKRIGCFREARRAKGAATPNRFGLRVGLAFQHRYRRWFIERWPEVGDGVNRERRRIVGVFEPPLLHRRSDTPCPTIAWSS